MLLRSWRTYENYTGPLGLQTLTDIVGPHFGPAVEASERNGWGQWHRADHDGVGMDRTVATGTGYIGQYRPAVARMYESIESCPDDLLLFMHHVRYTHVLHSGKTVIQTIYDTHVEGADDAARYVDEWRDLEGRVGEPRYGEVLSQLEYQAGHARVWRDAVATWFWKTSGIPDAHGRIGSHPGRTEAEAMALAGYQPLDVLPWEAASGSRAVACTSARCSARFTFSGTAGWYEVITQYFDQRDGAASFELWLNDQRIDAWQSGDDLPSGRIDAHTSTWRRLRGLPLRPGDTLRLVGTPDRADVAAIDYVEIRAEK
jgi:alpha-glucuronidase